MPKRASVDFLLAGARAMAQLDHVADRERFSAEAGSPSANQPS